MGIAIAQSRWMDPFGATMTSSNSLRERRAQLSKKIVEKSNPKMAFLFHTLRKGETDLNNKNSPSYFVQGGEKKIQRNNEAR